MYYKSNHSQCIYCKIDMVIGYAIESKDEDVKPIFNYYDKGKLIRCLKCPECGYSEKFCPRG